MSKEKKQPKTGYKGFDKNFKCRDMQYKVGEEFTHDGKVEPCSSGLHYCENPLDVLGYYDPANSRFAEVEDNGEGKTHNDDSKIATSKLYIKAEISLSKLLSGAVSFILSKVDFTNAKESNTGYSSAATNTGDKSAATNTGDSSAATNTGYSSAATNTGYSSAATNTGYRSAATNTGYSSAATNTGNKSAATNTGDSSAATNTGDKSAATNTGDSSAATNTGDKSAATNTGDKSAATNTGDSSAATNTGYSSAATNTGYSSAATNTGDSSAATVEGKESVAMSIGIEGKARGIKGCWIVIAEWEQNKNYNWTRKDVQCFKVDGKKIKENTFYVLKDGKPLEVE